MKLPKIPLSLTDGHRAQLHGSAISDEVIAERGYVTAFGPEPIKDREPRFSATQVKKKTAGLLIPIYRLGKPYAWMLKSNQPRVAQGEKVIKYEYPSGVAAVMDVLPRYRAALDDVTVPIWITEGAKKADALATAFGGQIVPVNLNGVYGWRTRKDALHKATATLSDLEEVPWQGREVVLAFDSDVRYNNNIRDALTRLSRVLAGRGACVRMLLLPQEKGAEKVGVDDFLHAGHSREDFMQHLQDAQQAATVGRQKIMRHPETGEDLYCPAGHIDNHTHIATEDNGRVTPMYRGRLAVITVGVDVATGEESFEVIFDRAHGTQFVRVVAPRADLCTGAGVLRHLGSRGAAVHDTNAKKVARFLVEFVVENDGAIPVRQFSGRLGNLANGTLITPSTSIGDQGDGEVRYTGPYAKAAGTDDQACVEMIKDISSWRGAWPLWLVIGFNLASPFMGRVGVRRNPVLYLAGESNSGKTTTANFAQGVWVEPGQHPFAIQAARTTEAGIKQTLEELNGLPIVLDEAHTIRYADALEGAVYGFANRQGYTKGGKDGRSRGGAALSGTFILTGEAVTEFKYAGSRNRVLYLDSVKDPPLGTDAPKGSDVGAERSKLLEDAWLRGAGHLGPRVARAVLANWSEYLTTVDALKLNLVGLADWADPCAVMLATLGVMFEELGLQIPDDVDALQDRIAEALHVSRSENPAHRAVWEDVTTLISQASPGQDGESVYLYYRGEVIGWSDSQHVYLLNNSDAFKQRAGKSGVQLHGQRWIEESCLTPARDGKATVLKHMPGRGTVRVLQIRRDSLLAE